jgi:hypothetical protein
MEWKKNDDNRVVFYDCEAEAQETDEAMVEMWRMLVSEVLPLNQEIDWDYIRVEIWPDSGRLIVIPAARRNTYRIEKAGCQVEFGALLAEYDGLDEEYADEKVTDVEFAENVTALEQAWAGKAVEAAKLTGLSTHSISFFGTEGDTSLLDVDFPQ